MSATSYEERFAQIERWNELNEAEEVTEWTTRAHQDFHALAVAQFGALIGRRVKGGVMDLFLPTYVAEVRGQAFASRGNLLRGGPRTGMDLDRYHLLSGLKVPILLIFAQGPTCWANWLHMMPQPARISRVDRAAGWPGRYGWTASELGGSQKTDEFVFPTEIPDAPDPGETGHLL
jgi:hypothetical protein